VAAAASWRFEYPGERVDVDGWMARVGSVDVVDIIAEAAALVK
jgi:hypothetical protein